MKMKRTSGLAMNSIGPFFDLFAATLQRALHGTSTAAEALVLLAVGDEQRRHHAPDRACEGGNGQNDIDPAD